jgi:branched-chain amino acid transport system permease protein
MDRISDRHGAHTPRRWGGRRVASGAGIGCITNSEFRAGFANAMYRAPRPPLVGKDLLQTGFIEASGMSLPISFLATQFLHGLVYGMLLFLVASGLTLVMGLMRITNIAHGSFYMLGAYGAQAVLAVTGSFWTALIVVPMVVGSGGLLVERTLLRRTRKLEHVHDLLLTFGLFFVLNEGVLWLWGSDAYSVAPPEVLDGTLGILGQRYPVYRLFMLAASLAICAAMFAVIHRTRAGMMIRSVVSDSDMAEAVGINTSALRLSVFGAGTALAAFAGVIAAPVVQADPEMASTSLMNIFLVIVLGGFGSLGGALGAALLLGQLQSFGVLFLPDLTAVLPLLAMALLLAARPQGMAGDRV